MTRITESEANLAGQMAEAEANGQCLFEILKKQSEDFLKDKELVKSIEKARKENGARYDQYF